MRASFPNHTLVFKTPPGQAQPAPPFRITLPDDEEPAKAGDKRGADGEADAGGEKAGANGAGLPGAGGELVVESYTPPDPGPYPQDRPRTNDVRFTPVQVEAIMSGAWCTVRLWSLSLSDYLLCCFLNLGASLYRGSRSWGALGVITVQLAGQG